MARLYQSKISGLGLALCFFYTVSVSAFPFGEPPSPDEPPRPPSPDISSLPTVAPNTADPGIRRQLETVLSGFQPLPSKNRFEQISPRIRPLLRGYVLEPQIFILYKKRALEALGYWPDDGTFTLYIGVLTELDVDESLKHRVLILLGSRFPNRIDHPAFRGILENGTPAHRKSAITGLSKAKTEKAKQLLEKRLQKESNPSVKKQIRRVLSGWED